MVRRVITVGLSESEINRAIQELENEKQEIIRRTDLLRQRIAERIANNSRSGFSGAIVDDLLAGEKRTAQVTVSADDKGNATVVIAKGEDAVWVEFGAGVYHNGSVGSSPHPNGANLGFTIGSHSQKGNGQKTTWGFYDENNELHITHGTHAVMPMYNAVKAVCDEISAIANEVFG